MARDGSSVIVGAPASSGDLFTGEAYVFDLVNDFFYSVVGRSLEGEGNGDGFGEAVAMNSAGDIFAVGGPNNDGVNGLSTGSVRVFQRTSLGAGFVQLGEDIDGEGILDSFGFAIALSADGYKIVIGALFHDGATGVDSGHAMIFQYDFTLGDWAPQQISRSIGTELEGEVAGDNYGYQVAISDAGDRIVVSARRNGNVATFNGAAYVYGQTEFPTFSPITNPLPEVSDLSLSSTSAGFASRLAALWQSITERTSDCIETYLVVETHHELYNPDLFH
ncbi:Membrane [Seminavis robusta]|uniref:Membrane n=1 Tax=Seminavis robusta TaxID=568900 RepID=A0A9N8D756_9STRA|nr:Membrane [Seminavis robusta]|eukprot:Sro4_g003760.1 Membrane (277) ;mRNA; f:236463-237404